MNLILSATLGFPGPSQEIFLFKVRKTEDSKRVFQIPARSHTWETLPPLNVNLIAADLLFHLALKF